jgi:hypothetical protein
MEPAGYGAGAGVVLGCVVVAARGVVVTVCAGAVTVLVGSVTVLVWVGLGDSTVTPRLLVVACLTTVEGDFDWLLEASMPTSTPRTAMTAMSGQIHLPCFLDVGAS